MGLVGALFLHQDVEEDFTFYQMGLEVVPLRPDPEEVLNLYPDPEGAPCRTDPGEDLTFYMDLAVDLPLRLH